MNKAVVLSVVRHFLTFLGGLLIAKGWADDGTIAELVGGLVTAAGATWSILEKRSRTMTAPKSVLLGMCLLSAGVLLAGCKSPEKVAYQTLGTTAALVDRAMMAWGDYVREGLAKAEDEQQVRALYEHYQAAMRVAKAAVVELKTTEDEGALTKALGAADAAAADLVVLVRRFVRIEEKGR